MIYQEDWETSKKRYQAFWQGEIIDRCCCAVTAPADKPFPCPPEREPRDLRQKWLDVGFRLEQTRRAFARTHYGGDAYPMFWNNLGPGVAAAFMGAGTRLAPDTVWFHADPPVRDWETRPGIKLDTGSPMWRTAWEMTLAFSEEANGDWLVGITDLGGNMDIAASLRGSDKLLYDLYDYPDDVKKLVGEIDAEWIKAYGLLQGEIEKHQAGSCAWMGMWCPGRWYPLQCDFSAMISTAMFDEFVKPALAAEAGWFDRAIYHLDGPGELCHLDSILEIADIDGIQCVPGTMFQQRTGSCYQSFANGQWMPVLRKIQQKGKLLVMNEVHAVELDELMENLSPKGLYLSMSCNTEYEARQIVKKIETWR